MNDCVSDEFAAIDVVETGADCNTGELQVDEELPVKKRIPVVVAFAVPLPILSIDQDTVTEPLSATDEGEN